MQDLIFYKMQKTYFISHGAPTLIIDDNAAHNFLKALPSDIEKPSAILVISAHWETRLPTTNSVQTNETIHDFYGFNRELYELKYNAPGNPQLANEICETLFSAGLQAQIDSNRGLDHGAWVPLKIMYPNADIPIVQLSIQSHLGVGHHFELGKALAHLREKNVLIIASGSFTHNLRALDWNNGPEADWSLEFSDWFHNAIIENRICDLMAYQRLAPNAKFAHPTDEHLLPIFVAMGAAGKDYKATRIHQSALFGSLRMDAYSFE